MSLDSILKHILGEAESEAERITQEAASGAERIRQEAKQEAILLEQAFLAKEKVLYESQKQQLMVNSRLESKRSLLNAKQELIDAVLTKLKTEIPPGKFKRYQVLEDKIKEVPEELSFYLNNLRRQYEGELAKILFA